MAKKHGGGGHGGVSLVDLETTTAEMFQRADIVEYLEHLPEADRARALVDLHAYIDKSQHYATTLANQGGEEYSKLYLSAVKHMENEHHGAGRRGFHTEVAGKKASIDDRTQWAEHLLDIALERFVREHETPEVAAAKFPHVERDDDGHGKGHGDKKHDKDKSGAQGESDDPIKGYLKKGKLKEERRQLVESILGQGSYRVLMNQLLTSKNIIGDLKSASDDPDSNYLLYKLFRGVAGNVTNYANRTEVVHRMSRDTLESRPRLIHDTAAPRMHEWGAAMGHEYGPRADSLTDHAQFLAAMSGYFKSPAEAVAATATSGTEPHKYVALKGGAKGGDAKAAH